ncbi:craniofacial development protein 2-like [Cydia strobilella]|uniref:craniofacial development protein 2-like n=1 Tax=Cydia strobilella TaxID=1100964 RepID=UPI003004ECC1
MRPNHNKIKRTNARASPSSDGYYGYAANARASPRSDENPDHRLAVPLFELRIATWNIGTMTGRSAELSAILERRRINLCCVQETKWKGAKSRQIGKGFKLIYNGIENTKNGVGIVLDKYLSENVVEINRISDRIMSVKIALEKQPCLNVLSVYAPQVNCQEAEKQQFWEDLHDLLKTLPATEQKVVCGDLNGHVGKDRDGFEGYHGGFGFGRQNSEGATIMEFAASQNLAVVNTFFQKKEEHLITYKSGRAKTQIDYILIDKQNLKQIKDCKIIPGEPLTSQHRLLLAALKLRKPVKIIRPKVENIKWHELKTEKGNSLRKKIANFMCEHPPRDNTPTEIWKKFENHCVNAAKLELGTSKGALHNTKDTKWWNTQAKDSVSEKKRLFKIWQKSGSPEDKELYQSAKKTARRTVATEKERANIDLYQRLELATDTDVYKIAKHRYNDCKDFRITKYIKNEEGLLLTDNADICKRWHRL